MPLELNLGDVVRLKRAHPCGGTDWEVTRLGADIGLRCLTCNRRVMLERPILERRLREFVSRVEQAGNAMLDMNAESHEDEASTPPRPSGGQDKGES